MRRPLFFLDPNGSEDAKVVGEMPGVKVRPSLRLHKDEFCAHERPLGYKHIVDAFVRPMYPAPRESGNQSLSERIVLVVDGYFPVAHPKDFS